MHWHRITDSEKFTFLLHIIKTLPLIPKTIMFLSEIRISDIVLS